MTPKHAAPEGAEREAFEAWYVENMDLRLDPVGGRTFTLMWRASMAGYSRGFSNGFQGTRQAEGAVDRSQPVGAGMTDATEEMTDAVRPLIVAIELAGRTYGSVRSHCKRAGMDVDAWPAWARETPAGEHFTKAACAALIWHCMAALSVAASAPAGWKDVRTHGLPPCDGETVYVGENDAGYLGCFNELADGGHCLMQTPEGCDVVMSGLRFWRVQDRPASPSLPVSGDGKEGQP